jgi:hypothetical protein
MTFKNIFSQFLRNNKLSFNLLGYYFKRTLPLLFYPFTKNKEINKIVFFIGNQGDGLSFVTRIIRRNKNIVSISGDSKYWSGPDELATVMEYFLPYNLRLPGLLTKEKLKTNLSPPRSWSYGSNNFYKHYTSDENDFSYKVKKKFIKAISTSLTRFGSNKIFIDKSQVYSLKMKLLKKIFGENVYFIHITRNPLVSCYRASIGYAGDLKRYSKKLSKQELLQISVEHWNNTSEEIMESKNEVDNYMRIKFEDILENPEKNIKEICDFIGIEFDYDMLPSPKHILPKYSKFRDRWYPIRKDLNSKYLNNIDDKSYNFIKENLNKNLLEEQNYIIK